MMENDAQAQIKELQGKIQALRSTQLAELRAKLADARAAVATLEHQIAKVAGKDSSAAPRRQRTSSEEVHSRILNTLSSASGGLTQREISERAGVNYNTVVLYFKKRAREFKATGTPRSRRYALK